MQALDPAQAGQGRGMHPLSQGLIAQAGIRLQLRQQLKVGKVYSSINSKLINK